MDNAEIAARLAANRAARERPRADDVISDHEDDTSNGGDTDDDESKD